MVIEWLRRVRYRVQQFLAALHAHVTPAEVAALHGVLPAAGLALFCRMPVADQRHSLDVCAALRQQGYADPDLLAAALLHDVAKAGHIHLWHRVALVLLKSNAPGQRVLARLARPVPTRSLRYPFYVSVHHPTLGAQQALAAGCSSRTAWLIAHHQTPITAPQSADQALLAALQKVDDEL